jgi:hypothetical protein
MTDSAETIGPDTAASGGGQRARSWRPRKETPLETRLRIFLESPGGMRQMQCAAALAVSLKLLLNKVDQAFAFGHGLTC